MNIVLQGDAGFCSPMIPGWCDRHQVDYLISMGQNSRLLEGARSARYKDQLWAGGGVVFGTRVIQKIQTIFL
ncbi:hypothetical protein [Gynuella sp.]|uniref:hypothetical protein n=1 Tax=Gynuella sp. TaxID=2969146 RepID=UPI003D111FCB